MTNRLEAESSEASDTSPHDGPTVVRRCELALLRWARAVAATRGVAVSDFSKSFADGAALCALIHAYAPELVHLREIKRVDKSSTDLRRFGTAAHDAVASNFALAGRAVSVLAGTESAALRGGVPFDARDASFDARGPDAEVVAGFLLELRRALLRRGAEHAAARVDV